MAQSTVAREAAVSSRSCSSTTSARTRRPVAVNVLSLAVAVLAPRCAASPAGHAIPSAVETASRGRFPSSSRRGLARPSKWLPPRMCWRKAPHVASSRRREHTEGGVLPFRWRAPADDRPSVPT
jgi:hypothetical protein